MDDEELTCFDSQAVIAQCEGNQPDPPVNVRIEFEDGQVIPIECRYVGWSGKRKMHHWAAVTPAHLQDHQEWHVRVDYLPACTSIEIEFAEDSGGRPADGIR